MNWLSRADLVSELGLKSSPSDADALRSEIRTEIAELHPDHNNGVFASADDQPRYQRLVEALDYLDHPPSTALIPIHEVPALVAAVRQALVPQQPAHSPAQARAEFRDLARAELHQHLSLPRIGSGVFASACAFLLTVGDKLNDNPIFGGFLQTRTGSMTVAMLLLYSALFFVMTWWMEQRASAQHEWLATEGGRREIFARVLQEQERRGAGAEDTAARFSFSQVVRAILVLSRPRLPFPFIKTRISRSAAEKLAKAHLDELEAREVVRKASTKRLDVIYEIAPEAAEDMSRHFLEQ